MEDYSEIYEKANLLIQSAFKKYAEGDFEGGDADREEANEMLDSVTRENDRNRLNMSILYGENKNFGIIYKVLESNMQNLILSKKGIKVIKEMIKTIKSDKILNEQFKLYNIFTEDKNIDNSEKYIEEAVSLIKTMNKKDVNESNLKLIKLIRDNKLNEMVDIDEDLMGLFESVEYLLLNDKKYSNIDEYISAKSTIKEFIEKRNDLLKEEKNNIDLTEEEENFIYNLTNENVDKEVMFYQYKNETIEKINNILSECDATIKDRMLKILSSVTEKKYNQETVVEDIMRFSIIQDTIDE